MYSLKNARLYLLAACTAILAACGGGGSSGGGTTPTPPPPVTFTVGGTVSGLAAGVNVVLQNSGTNNTTVSANGAFTFSTAINSGTAYAVTVLTQPIGQTCTVASGTGTIAANVTNVAVTCVTPPPATFTVGGTLSGLATGASVVLRNNGGNNLSLSANGAFTFSTAINTGTAYAVTVFTQPTTPAQVCVVTNGTGTITANVTNVAVACTTNAFTVGGTVTGLATGGTVVLQNNGGNNLNVTANGAFTFTTPLTPGTAYAVTRLTNPTVPGPGQVCTVSNGAGTMAGANVTSVAVACVNSDTTAPTITARSPLPTAVGSKMQGAVITVTFNEAILAGSVTAASFAVTGPAGAVNGTLAVTGAGNNQVTFTPAAPSTLTFDANYTVTLTNAIRDVSNNALAAGSTWSFNSGKKLALGDQHGCARFYDGRVKCWGLNDSGQLGYDNNRTHGNGVLPADNTNTLAAVNLGAGRTAVQIAAGDYHNCARLDDDTVKCWGRNEYGELGRGAVTPGPSFAIGDAAGEMATLTTVNVGTGRTIIDLELGQHFSCARLDNGTAKCWGRGLTGQLGQGSTTNLGVAAGDIAAAPAINFGTGLTPRSLSAGHHHVCAVLTDVANAVSLKCWGGGQWGQMGKGHRFDIGVAAGEMGDSLTPVDLGTGTVASVDASGGHTCARLTNGDVRCWGLNTWGQGGDNAGNGSPIADPLVCTGNVQNCIGDEAGEMGASLFTAIGTTTTMVTAYRHNCVFQAGALKCWGSNEEGQLGLAAGNAGANVRIGDAIGEMTTLATTPLQPGTTVEEISTGGFYTCVYKTNATINCWGHNNLGQLGQNNTNNVGDGPGETGAALVDVNLGT